MNKIRIIRDNSLVGIGSNILRGLHYLYYNDNSDILYLDFENILYGDQNVNVWNLFLKQPFEEYIPFIEFNKKNNNVSYETLNLNIHPFLFSYGRTQENGKYFEDKEKVTNFRKSLNCYLNFQNVILDKVNKFVVEKINGAKTLSLHVRGTDQFSSSGHAQGQRHLFEYTYIKSRIDEKINHFDFVFLATDEQEIHDNFKRDFGDKIISYSTIFAPKGSQTGLHSLFTNKSSEEKYLMGEEAIIDSIIMSRCEHSFYVKSNISLLSILLRKDFNYEFIDNHIDYGKLG